MFSKWSHDYVPVNRRDKWWKPFTYCYETQVSMFKEEKSLNLEFFSDWTLEEVEKYMEEMFEKMKLNYYESWSGERRTRPQIREFKVKIIWLSIRVSQVNTLQVIFYRFFSVNTVNILSEKSTI